MRLFLNADTDSLSGQIDSSFGRCSYFFIYETEDESFKFLQNPHQDIQSSVGASVAQSAIELKINAVIAVNLGPRAFKLLKEADIEVYHATEGTPLRKVISQFENNELLPLEDYLPHHG